MLSLLHIENIAVVEMADLEPGSGFNVLTGETGAGKSIIIDAISAIVGERMSRDLIRSGEQSAVVSALFTGLTKAVLLWLEDNGYTANEDNTLLISRQLSADGRNICKINGRPVTVTLLKQLGSLLINIHGQHDNQNLLDDANHLGYLDSLASHDALLATYRESYESLNSTKRDIEKLSINQDEKARRIDSLRFRINEIETSNLVPGEEETLSARRDILRNSERINDAVEECFASLYGGEDSVGAASLIEYALSSIDAASGFDPRLDSLHKRLLNLKFEAEDLVSDIRDLRGDYVYSPEEMEYTEERLDIIFRLKRKYGGSIDEILENLESYRAELDNIEFSDEKIEKLRKKMLVVKKETCSLADKLTESRKLAGNAMSSAILSELKQLDMPSVRFVTAIDRLQQLNPNGQDAVRFLLSANAGEEPKPLAKIASGGELSRIMLAMKNVLAEKDSINTLIFDEVDAGVSGRAAQKVAEKLAQASRHKQVLCVTHLPQIAAMADSHFLIKKSEAGGRTYTSVDLLNEDDQKREVARIISGSSVTETTIKSAEELILSAELFRKDMRKTQ